MKNDNFFVNSHNIELELCVQEAIVLHEFVKRQIMKKRFRIGDKAERNALDSLFAQLNGYHLKAWDENLEEAKELMKDYRKSFELGAKRAHKANKET